MNSLTLTGRLVKDPEIRMTPAGLPIARYTLAVDRPKRQGQDAKADFFYCTAFGKSAEFAEKYMKKGMKMLISGSMQNDNYQGKDGKTVYSWQVIVDNQEFCESRPKEPVKPETPVTETFMPAPELDDEELPFNF